MGELIFESHSLTIGWDGYYKGDIVPTGVYVWKIDIVDFEGIIHKYSGHVNVIY